MGYDPTQSEELLDILPPKYRSTPAEQVFYGPFSRPFFKRNPGRFSDGSFQIRYSALDSETAVAEKKRHIPSKEGPELQRFRLCSATFEGRTKDLRSKLLSWPQLVATDHRFCGLIGVEAYREGLDGLLVPSAELEGGSNLAIFLIESISAPADLGLVELSAKI